MNPIHIELSSGEWFTLHSDCPSDLMDTIQAVGPSDIVDVKMGEDVTPPDLFEVSIGLADGKVLLGLVTDADFKHIETLTGIQSFQKTHLISYAKMNVEERAIDAQLVAASLVLNNLPDSDVRHTLHKEYIRRKRAYASAMEALIDGVINRRSI